MEKETNKGYGFRTKYQYGAGVDVHKNYVIACVAVKRSNSIERQAIQQFPRNPVGLREMSRFLKKYLLSTIVMESTGVYTPFVKEGLEKTTWHGITPKILVINPSMIRKFPGELHADPQDAFDLAKLGILGLAEPSFLPKETLKEIRWLSRRIFFYTKDCTRVKNRIKQNLDLWGLSLPQFDLNSTWALDLCRILIFQARGNMKKTLKMIEHEECSLRSSSITAISRRKEKYERFFDVQLPRSAIRIIELQLANLSAQNAIINAISKEIEMIINDHPNLRDKVDRLTQIPGIEERSATTLLSEIGNIRRFPTVKKFLQYVGCAPTIYQSGTIRKASHLNKRVNHFCKLVFMHAGRAVCSNVKKDSDLKEFGRKQLNRHWNNKKLAHANTGIKVARIVYHLLLKGEEYQPFYETRDTLNVTNTKAKTNKAFQLSKIRRKTRRYFEYLRSALEHQHAERVQLVYDEIKTMWNNEIE
ncbi:MAG: IS110 family transposase [Candidatus Lokiarchaeota archaeon]|nr:IS110 family transposase [Candidatus Lokiarchaeota archaeon]